MKKIVKNAAYVFMMLAVGLVSGGLLEDSTLSGHLGVESPSRRQVAMEASPMIALQLTAMDRKLNKLSRLAEVLK